MTGQPAHYHPIVSTANEQSKTSTRQQSVNDQIITYCDWIKHTGALTDKNDSITVMPLECTQDNATYNHRIYCHGDTIMAMVISPIVLVNSFQCCTEMMKC